MVHLTAKVMVITVVYDDERHGNPISCDSLVVNCKSEEEASEVIDRVEGIGKIDDLIPGYVKQFAYRLL
jgi:hypothetical protein